MWEKMGLIFNVNSKYAWNKSHAQVPVVDVLVDKLRVYYSTRNKNNQSGISYIEVDKKDPSNILYEHTELILPLGNLGTFDDCGTMPSCIITVGHKKYLYYIGWTTRGSVPYHNSVGLAISEDEGKTFEKKSIGPIITMNSKEPYFSGTSFVIQESKLFKMWYLSCTKWEKVNDKPEPFYNIKYAESLDGVNWKQNGEIAIDLEGNEGGLVSSSVFKEIDSYKMWYGVRNGADYRLNIKNTYRIGYAESQDGKKWNRKDFMAGITLSESGWDSEMISYPYVICVEGELLMFYNGNGFGKTGFGYAKFLKK